MCGSPLLQAATPELVNIYIWEPVSNFVEKWVGLLLGGSFWLFVTCDNAKNNGKIPLLSEANIGVKTMSGIPPTKLICLIIQVIQLPSLHLAPVNQPTFSSFYRKMS